MAELDPRTDFQDDGGTPMWRGRHRVIDVTKPQTFWQRLRRVRTIPLMAFLFIWGFIGVWIWYIGCLVGAAFLTPERPYIAFGVWSAVILFFFYRSFMNMLGYYGPRS